MKHFTEAIPKKDEPTEGDIFNCTFFSKTEVFLVLKVRAVCRCCLNSTRWTRTKISDDNEQKETFFFLDKKSG